MFDLVDSRCTRPAFVLLAITTVGLVTACGGRSSERGTSSGKGEHSGGASSTSGGASTGGNAGASGEAGKGGSVTGGTGGLGGASGSSTTGGYAGTAGEGGAPDCDTQPEPRGPVATLAFELITIEPMDAYAIAAGDFNGDCYPDLAAVAYAGIGVSVALKQPHGSGFAAPGPSGRAAGGVPPNAIAVGDFNRDGRLDTVTTGYRSVQATVAFGTGDGAFNADVETDLGQRQPQRIVPSDLNRDGILDLVFTPPVGSLLGNGDGTFRIVDPLSSFAAIGRSTSFAFADFDEDGQPDIVSRDTALFIFFGTAEGAFQGRDVSSPLTDVGEPVMSGDLDEDGHADLFGSTGMQIGTGGVVQVARGNGEGLFGPVEMVPAGEAPRLIGAFDLNLDGHLDLVVANLQSEELRILPGRGDATFGEASVLFVGPAFSFDNAVFTDFNRDGLPDFAVAGREDAQVFISVSH